MPSFRTCRSPRTSAFGLLHAQAAEGGAVPRGWPRRSSIVSLTGLEDRRPGQLSGGQQQRVALARAIVTRPDILLFDEPLSNLDAKLREKVRIEIRDLQRRLGITSIYVTHDQAEALVISDRIVVMNRGRIEQIGDPDTIYRAPDNALRRRFHRRCQYRRGHVARRPHGRHADRSPAHRRRAAAEIHRA